jgi:hypothetical protein
MFSLGALAYLVFTGRAPGASPTEVDQRLSKSSNLDPRVVDGLQEEVADMIAKATERSPVNRHDDPEAWIEERTLFSPRGAVIALPRHRVQDIDTPEDWRRAELMFAALGAG